VFYFPPHPTSAFALPRENRPSVIHVNVNETTSINSIYPNLRTPTAGPAVYLQGLTVIQQCDYVMKFKNVYEVKKQLYSLE